MEKYNNMATLVENSIVDRYSEVDVKLLKLINFTLMSDYNKSLVNRFPLFKYRASITTKKDGYTFNYNGKKYPFSLLSDWDLQDIDKNNLKSTKKGIVNNGNLIRNLKLACSIDVVNPKLIMGNSDFRALDSLISFEENGTEKIIDYSKNLIMKKEDYFDLFKFEVLNILEKWKLYNIYIVLSEADSYELLYEFLLFYDEIFDDLAKNEMFDEVNVKQKFNYKGFNRNNSCVLGRKCDSLYFGADDNRNYKYKVARDEINEFTLNPNTFPLHIRYDDEKKKYIYEDDEFGYFQFGLISDIVDQESVKKNLLSEDRFHKCHVNSHHIMDSLNEDDRKEAYLVAGMIKANEVNNFYHSWVEIDSKNAVIDYNHNIIMNRDKYYKLYGAQAIQKTKAQDMDEIYETLINEVGLYLQYMDINYFGIEMLNDIKKNEKVFQKK